MSVRRHANGSHTQPAAPVRTWPHGFDHCGNLVHFLMNGQMTESTGFVSGFRSYLSAASMILSNSHLMRWYLRSLGWTLIFAGLCLAFLIFGGTAFWFGLLGLTWTGAGVAILWFLASLLISGQVAKAIVFGTIFLFSSEEKLLRAYFGPKFPAHTSTWGIVFRELGFLVVSVAVGILSALFLLFGLTFPLGILLSAWIYGFEVSRSGRRLLLLNGLESRPVSHRRALGLGIVPALLSVVPIIGWACLPLLLIAGLRAQSIQPYRELLTNEL